MGPRASASAVPRYGLPAVWCGMQLHCSMLTPDCVRVRGLLAGPHAACSVISIDEGRGGGEVWVGAGSSWQGNTLGPRKTIERKENRNVRVWLVAVALQKLEELQKKSPRS